MSKQDSTSDDGSLNIAFFSVLSVCFFLLFVFSEGEALPREGKEIEAVISSVDKQLEEEITETVALYENENALLVQSSPTHHTPQVLGTKTEKEEKAVRKMWVRLTAYAPLDPGATEGMCFSGDPSVTAAGTKARDGIVAANFLSFGTQIKIPSLFGDKVFTVEDRMSRRFTNTVDILVMTQLEAMNFGTKHAYIEIVN
jgi:3D (Asp-Asp-Asp) domain-containing protein